MKRRTLLRVVAFGGTGFVTGCLGGTGDSDNSNDGDEEAGSPSVTSREIRTNDAECASSPTGNQAVSINSRDGTVIVAGILSAPNPCHRAELDGAEYDGDADLLTVSVEAVEGDVDSCAQCVGAIDYNADIGFSGGLPGEVRVEHDGETVSTKEL